MVLALAICDPLHSFPGFIRLSLLLSFLISHSSRARKTLETPQHHLALISTGCAQCCVGRSRGGAFCNAAPPRRSRAACKRRTGALHLVRIAPKRPCATRLTPLCPSQTPPCSDATAPPGPRSRLGALTEESETAHRLFDNAKLPVQAIEGAAGSSGGAAAADTAAAHASEHAAVGRVFSALGNTLFFGGVATASFFGYYTYRYDVDQVERMVEETQSKPENAFVGSSVGGWGLERGWGHSGDFTPAGCCSVCDEQGCLH